MWPLHKPDPDPYIDPEHAFLLALLMAAGYLAFTILFPWWPVWTK